MVKPILSLALAFLLLPYRLPALDNPTATPTTAPIPTETPAPKTAKHTQDNRAGASQVIVVHKPHPPASWGKVVQFKREEILALSEKNRETLYEFVFQDEDGVIRTATYHENASGEGYWEVLVWDQP